MSTLVKAKPGNDISFDDHKLSFLSRLAYGGGDVAGQLVWSLGGSYLTLFYTDNVGLSAGVAAAVLLTARILDAIFDPIIGGIAERTRTRWGRFRPYILFGSVPLGLVCILTFTAPFSGPTAKVIWAVATYFILGLVYGLVNLPYSSLSAVMTRDTGERLSLNAFRMVGTNVGAVVLSAVSMPLIIHFSGETGGNATSVRGYTVTAALMAALSVVLFLSVVAACREVIAPVEDSHKMPVKEELAIVLRNRDLMLIFVSFSLALTAFFGRMGVQLYYYIYVMERPDLVPLLMALPPLAGAVGVALFTRVAKPIGKRNACIVSCVISGVTLGVLYLVPYDNVPVIIVLTAIFGLSNFAGAVLMSMVPDTVDKAEDETGFRTDGMSFAVISLAMKIGLSIGGAGGIALIGVFGYVANTRQSVETMNGINLVTNAVSGLIFLLAVIPILFYKLTEDQYIEIRARLEARGQANSLQNDGSEVTGASPVFDDGFAG